VTSGQLPTPDFIVTKEYRRFAEFCDACRDHRYVGLCYGAPGVGKTVSARRYAHWDELETLLGPPPHRHSALPPRDSGPWRTVLYTPRVTNTPRTIEREVDQLWGSVFGLAARSSWYAERATNPQPQPPDLVIVDQADRVKTAGLEQLRDLYDRRHVGLVLIGMPGLQKRLARYAQLYSRVGFVHQFRPLSGQELQQVIERQAVQLGLGLALGDTPDTAVVNTIARVTGGNFRLVERLFAQIQRVVQINDLSAVTTEVVTAAGESLVIGPL
jgi:DNA transposition AAA+ family ATPase